MFQRNKQVLDWALIDGWFTESPVLADYFAVVVLFLEDSSIIEIPSAINHQVENSARRIGRINIKILHWLIRRFPLSDRKRNWSRITVVMVSVFWQTMLQPRHKLLRPVVSAMHIFFRRRRGESLFRSIANRLRTFIRLLYEP